MYKNCAIFVFSGTGNTRYVVDLLKTKLENKGCTCTLFDISDNFLKGSLPDLIEFDLIGLAFPIHSYECPAIIYDLVKKIRASNIKPTFLLKTCADSSNSENGVISRTLIYKLRRRNFRVFYDRTVIIAANWLFSRENGFIRELASIADLKVAKMSEDIIQNKEKLYKSNFFFHKFVRIIYKLYLLFLKWVSKDLYTNESCSRCGKCIRICPKNNIKQKNGRIVFGWSCISCMRCLYSCPEDAINYRLFKSFKLKNGYNLQKILKEKDTNDDLSWKMTREYRSMEKYLENIDL